MEPKLLHKSENEKKSYDADEIFNLALTIVWWL
jgi:hypothetical protein